MLRALFVVTALALACDSEPAKAPEKQPEPVKAEPARAEPPKPVEPAKPPPDANEACAGILVVAWAGAEGAEPGVTRDEAAARARAAELKAKLSSGTALAELAAESDEPKTKAKRGAMGTFERAKWPEKYAPLADALFALHVGEVTEPIKHPHGFVVAKRCAVEKIHSAHILVRYKGAKNAEAKIKRSKADAHKLAEKVHKEVTAPGADFSALAKKYSEDGSAERGGDMGTIGRGMFVPPYEDAAFALAAPGDVSGVVESDFGFHVIRRVD